MIKKGNHKPKKNKCLICCKEYVSEKVVCELCYILHVEICVGEQWPRTQNSTNKSSDWFDKFFTAIVLEKFLSQETLKEILDDAAIAYQINFRTKFLPQGENAKKRKIKEQ